MLQLGKTMYHFIMNPKASSGKGMKAWKTIEEILQREQVAYKAHVLGSAQETTDFVKMSTGGDEDLVMGECATTVETVVQQTQDCHIVVLGGDGTINAVLNGIVDFEHTKLSCIRTGSGNDFARNLGINKNVTKAMEHLLHSPEQLCLDFGEAVYTTESDSYFRRFAISNGVGYDADICEEVGRSKLKKILN